MLLYKKNPHSIVTIHKDAPRVGEPYHADTGPSVFYRNDPEMNALIGGYSEGPKDSYAKELMAKYPLQNE